MRHGWRAIGRSPRNESAPITALRPRSRRAGPARADGDSVQVHEDRERFADEHPNPTRMCASQKASRSRRRRPSRLTQPSLSPVGARGGHLQGEDLRWVTPPASRSRSTNRRRPGAASTSARPSSASPSISNGTASTSSRSANRRQNSTTGTLSTTSAVAPAVSVAVHTIVHSPPPTPLITTRAVRPGNCSRAARNVIGSVWTASRPSCAARRLHGGLGSAEHRRDVVVVRPGLEGPDHEHRCERVAAEPRVAGSRGVEVDQRLTRRGGSGRESPRTTSRPFPGVGPRSSRRRHRRR